jgi:acyl-homoserine lactone acylase PvdQ
MIGKLIGYLIFIFVSVALVSILGLYYVYSPVTEGTLYLKHAKGEAEIIREVDTGIPHVYASS